MGVSIDCASSILFCSEDALGLYDGEEEGGDGRIPGPSSALYGDLLMGFPLLSEESLGVLVAKETEHLPAGDYRERLTSGALDPSVRRDAIDWISKVHAYYSFGPLSAYLSVNFFDRFLSVYELPQGKTWMTQLLSVACLSLAAKMEETVVPLPLDLQIGEAKYVFEARTIQRMELLVLSTLKWRMQAVTPFSFIDHFLHKFNGDNCPTMLLISRSAELVLSMIRDIGFLEFKPSEIAAAVALSTLAEAQMVETGKPVDFDCKHVNKERALRCYDAIQEMALMKSRPLKHASPSGSSVPQSPNGVLDVACLSYKSDDITVGSHANSLQSSPAAKRRKLSRP